MQPFRQILDLIRACKIAIVAMVDEIRHSGYIKRHARRAATHGFHNSIGQVVLQGGRDEHIGG